MGHDEVHGHGPSVMIDIIWRAYLGHFALLGCLISFDCLAQKKILMTKKVKYIYIYIKETFIIGGQKNEKK